MTDYNTMTAQACADWLAEREHGRHGEGDWYRLDDYQGVAMPHPYPLTLDAAAAALREPWRLVKVAHYGSVWSCHIERLNPWCERLIVDAHDRMTAEYRAAVAARMEEER